MRDRGTLHQSKRNEFVSWAVKMGWKEEKPKGDFEVLRLRHPSQKEPAIFFQRMETDHFTAYGQSHRLMRQYMNDKK